jgi:hypothetical protein
MEFFCKQVHCRRTSGIKVNRYPNFLCQDTFLDAFGLCVGSPYHIDEIYHRKINSTPFGNIDLQLVKLHEFPNDLFLRSGFSE